MKNVRFIEFGIFLVALGKIHSLKPGKAFARGPKVRDRLCQIIRQHNLDPELVKAYAVGFCGAKTLHDATREQVENFVHSLADWAEKDRNALLCQLNSYARPKQEDVACSCRSQKKAAFLADVEQKAS